MMENNLAIIENFPTLPMLKLEEQKAKGQELQKKRRRNLGEKADEFKDFSDKELIDYYILRYRNVYRKEQSLSENTKRTYFTDLYQFYDLINLSYLQRGLSFDKLFANLSKADVEFYFHLIVDGNVPTSEERTYKNGQVRTIFKYVNYKPASSAKKITIVKQFISWLYKHKIIKENLILSLPSVQLSEHERPNRDIRFPDTQFILQHFFYQNKERFALFLLAATSGLRVGAIATIQMRDISYEYVVDGFYYVIKVKEKGDKWRESVHLPEIFDYFLASRRKMKMDTDINSSTGPLFVNARGEQYTPTALSKAFSDWLKPLNIEFQSRFGDMKLTAHIFRHAYAIYFREVAVRNPKTAELIGFSTADIASSLGHASDKITKEVYLSHTLRKEQDLGRFIKLSDFIPPFDSLPLLETPVETDKLNTAQVMEMLELDNKNVFLRLIREEYLQPLNKETLRLDGTYFFDKKEVEDALKAIEKLDFYQLNRLKKLGYLSINQAIKEFMVLDRNQLNHWIKDGKIPFAQAGNAFLIAPEEIEKLLKKEMPTVDFRLFQRLFKGETHHIILDIQPNGKILCVEESKLLNNYPKTSENSYISAYDYSFNQQFSLEKSEKYKKKDPIIPINVIISLKDAQYSAQMASLLDFINQTKANIFTIRKNQSYNAYLELEILVNDDTNFVLNQPIESFKNIITNSKQFALIKENQQFIIKSKKRLLENIYINEDILDKLAIKAKIEDRDLNEFIEEKFKEMALNL